MKIKRRSIARTLGAGRQARSVNSLLVVSTAVKSPGARGGLTPWRKRKVETFLNTHLHRSLPLAEMAQQATLSVSHFCRAFRETFGNSPHAHIVRLRVEAAKRLMLDSGDPLSHIAYACGFADQSHLTKQFLRYVGETPHVWRRSNIRDRCSATLDKTALPLGIGHDRKCAETIEACLRPRRGSRDDVFVSSTTF